MKTIFAGTLAWSTMCAALAQGCAAISPAHTVALVELYTSEGCSSCPPADAFLSARKAQLRPDQAVLLSLHVDYWNYIGWKDPYSSTQFTERQRWLSDLARTRTIYTPEFFIAGKELRNWNGALEETVKRVNARPAQASISIGLAAAEPAGLPVQIRASGAPGAMLHVALVENGLSSKVAAGENNGRILRHDAVVRTWSAPVVLGKDGKAELSRLLEVPPGAVHARLGVAAFVQTSKGEVLQALSLAACSRARG